MHAADLETPKLVDALTGLVLGTIAAPKPAPTAAVAGGSPTAAGGNASSPTATAANATEEALQQRSAAAVGVRLKAVGYLSKSKAACARFPGTLQAVFHCIFGGDATPKLQLGGVQLAQWVVAHAPAPLLSATGGHLLSAMLKVRSPRDLPVISP